MQPPSVVTHSPFHILLGLSGGHDFKKHLRASCSRLHMCTPAIAALVLRVKLLSAEQYFL